MGTKFSDFFQAIVEEAIAEGEQAVKELQVFREIFQQKRNKILCKTLGHVVVGAQGTTHMWCDRCQKYLGCLWKP